jgi:hypothetical protein
MTTDQPLSPKPSVYEACDPKYLRELREAAQMDLVVLARTACLSVAQVRQLESDGSDSLFYSDAIKHQAYKRLLMILGAEPPSVEVPESMRDPEKVAQAHLHTLDQIVAMSSQPAMSRPSTEVVRAVFSALAAKKQVLAALTLLIVAVILFALHGPHHLMVSASVVTAASEAAALLPKPVLLADKPITQEAAAPVVVASMQTPTPVPAHLAVTVPIATDCRHTQEALPQAIPLVVTKEGRYVYLVSSANTEVCVVDGSKQATVLQLRAGENRSVYGPSPWQVSGANLEKVQIYFQGGRVALPSATTHRMSLVEAPVVR